MDLNKHIISSDNYKPFHSSGLARIASGDRLGSVANTSFEKRLQIEDNRQLIGKYQRSTIGNPHGQIRVPIRKTIKLIPINAPLGRQARGANIKQANPIRRYDPYA